MSKVLFDVRSARMSPKSAQKKSRSTVLKQLNHVDPVIVDTYR